MSHPVINKLADVIIGNPKKVVLLSTLVCFGFLAFLPKLDMGQVRTEDQLRKADPALLKYNKFVEEFGNDLDLMIAYDAKDGLFTVENLKFLKKLTQDLETLPTISKVTSLANADYQWVGEESFSSRLFLDPDYMPETDAEAAELGKAAANYEPYQNRLFGKEQKTAVILVRPKPGMPEALQALIEVKELLAKPDYDGLEVRMLGEAVGVVSFMQLLFAEAMKLTLLSLIVMAVLLFICFRSFWGVFAPGILTFMIILMTVATFAMFGHTFSDVALMCTIILLAVSLADAIHYYGHYAKSYSQSGDKIEANRDTFRHVFVPCLFTSLSTAVGFASLSIASNLSLVYLGIHAAIGCLLAFGMTFTFLSGLLAILPPPKKMGADASRPALIDKAIDGIFKLNTLHGGKVMAGFVLICLLSALGIPKLRFDQDNFASLPKDHPVVKDTQYLSKVVGIGGSLLQVVVKGDSEALQELEAMRQIDRLEAYIRTLPLVRKVTGIPDSLKLSYRIINEDDPAFYKLPDDDTVFHQLFYLAKDNENTGRLLNFDNSKTVINISIDQALASAYDEVYAQILAWVEQNPDWPANLTVAEDGILAMSSAQYHRLMGDQVKGFSLALTLITIMMCLLFRSVRVGLISIVPNVVPILVVLGLMGFFNIFMSTAMIIVANVAISLAVDDTIHFLYNYREQSEALDFKTRLRKTLDRVGMPLVFTTLILVCSMLSFTISSIPMMVQIGILMAIPISVALIADLFLLPGILRHMFKRSSQTNQDA